MAERRSRRWLWIGAVLVAGAALLSASQTTLPFGGPGRAAAAVAAAPRVVVSPADGSTDVAPATAITVAAFDATLQDVTVTAADGTPLPGALSADGRTWSATQRPAFATEYRFSGTAAGPGGSVAVTGTFRTADPQDRLVTASAPWIGEGATVGIAAPIELRFDTTLSEEAKAAVERRLTVKTSVPVEGSWGWLPDTKRGSRVHWRPKDYWPPNTQVTVHAALYGVPLGDAGFGESDLTRSFTIGRAQIVKADVTSHRMVVIRDGEVVLDVPASYGLESDSRRVTRSGIHVVTSKSPTVYMTNPTFGYYNVKMHWAVRISDNGEFIHANPASAYAHGRQNVTHGCVNLSTANAKAYYDTALYGDPVEVVNSSVPLSKADGDVYDWTLSWEEWQSLSALAPRS
ncbi:L,D-transpeptidase [Pseudonocardia thermophila]|uniref:L,D-transpeptidase n=1 Tax=Pseudonocardia thermophila TaxID=1848 RepID=UPI00248E2020|nr:Ig-like domain-containing protein [Pseudonocardia thermophila]